MSDFVLFSIAGTAAGLLAGLFGIGGGLVMVPVLLVVFASLPKAAVVPMALGTSVAVIVFSAMSSAFGHYRKQAVDLSLVKRVLPALAGGAIAGSFAASWAPRSALLVGLAMFQAGLLVYMVRKTFFPAKQTDSAAPARKPSQGILGGIGVVCAMAGIGGGTLSVPYFRYLGIAPRTAVGTSSALGVPIALSAAIGFAVAGVLKDVSLPYSVGYVNFLALICMVPTAIVGAQVGATIAHRIAPKLLMGLFCGFLALSTTKSLWSLLT